MPRTNWLTCDPGTQGTGFALWYNDKLLDTKVFKGKLDNWNLNRKLILMQTQDYLAQQHVPKMKLFIEEPQFMEQGHRGITSARSGSLFKLITFYGGLLYQAELANYAVHPVKINDWKGQRSKAQTHAWIRKLTDKNYPDHVADAVGIGLYLIREGK